MRICVVSMGHPSLRNPPHLSKNAITAEAVPDEWIAVVRELIQREGRALRGPVDRPTIEVKSLHTNRWSPVMLFSSAMAFETIADRDAVLAKILAPEVSPQISS